MNYALFCTSPRPPSRTIKWIKNSIKISLNPYKHWVFVEKHPLKSPYIIYILGRNERMRNLSKPL
nr:MAG TPA: hypothetical protein [Caudoviricetes sp.]